jgi:Transposase DDE domain
VSINRIDYCQFLLSAQSNFTMTHFADHGQGLSHDAVNRLLRRDKLTGQIIWEHVKGDIVASPRGCLVFDDSILDKNHSHHIELVRLQYSGNAHGLVKGIGMVNCLYVNPDTGQYWIVDYRIFDPEGDGKTKLDHVREMLVSAIAGKALAFSHVLFDSWYATKDLMLFVESLDKRYYCPLKSNRQVDDSGGEHAYCRVDSLDWSEHAREHGKLIKIKGFPKDHKVKLFRVEVSTNRTDWVVSNDLEQDSTQGAQDACALRWKIEQFHRELKQLTGVEKCQCRKARIQRNHIACAVLVWIRLTAVARKACSNVYKLKRDMRSGYLRQELRSPSVRMAFA